MDTQTALQRLEFMDSALSALRYLDTLLDLALNADGGALSDKSSGLHCLMNAHLNEIGDGLDLLRGYVKQGEQGPVKRRRPPEGFVCPPVYDQNSLRAEIAAEEAAVARLRRADLEAVARDTKLAEDTVRRVVDRLLAEPSEATGRVSG